MKTNVGIWFEVKQTWKIVFVLKRTEPEFRFGSVKFVLKTEFSQLLKKHYQNVLDGLLLVKFTKKILNVYKKIVRFEISL